MSKLYDAFKTDRTAEQNGVWVDMGGAQFKVARMGGANVKYQRQLTAGTRPMMREIQLGLADEGALDKIMKKTFLDTVLLDWQYTDEDGALHEHEIPGEDDLPVVFNKDTASKLLDDLPDLYLQLRDQAQNYANYRAAALEIASKN